jgi:acid stress-induced BolA-like protein IbaG/YrbA
LLNLDFPRSALAGAATPLIDWKLNMTAEELQQLIAADLPCEHLEVTGDGRHWAAVIVSPAFEGMRSLARHKRVYDTLGDRIQNDEVHALSMKTYSPAEWAKQP